MSGAAAGTAADPGDDLRLDRQLCFALYDASREVVRLYRPLLEPLGLTYTQYVAMLALWERDGVSVGSLGARLSLDTGTLTPLLKKLESMGLVNRVRDERDERSVRVSLTPAGRVLRERAAAIPPAAACASGLDPVEIAEMRDRLHRLVRDLRAAGGNPAPDADV